VSVPTQSYAGQNVELDADGFFARPADWSEAMADPIATALGVKLEPDAWKVIRFARSDFGEKGCSPGLRRITASTGVGTKEIYRMFPKGPGKLVAKIAGIPKPKSCL
jgi:tRNA 2-thiouridine synthesizing protein E